MFDLIVVISRYYFIFLIAYFLWLGVKYILCERGFREGELSSIANTQNAIIMLMSGFAFLILAYKKDSVTFDVGTLLMGGGVLAFLIFGRFMTRIIYKKGCPLMWNAMFFLLNVSFIMLQRLNPALALKQLIFCFAGFVVMLLIPVALKIIPKFEKLEYVYLLICICLLGVLFFMASEEYGAKNWLSIGGFSFQPSELVKIMFVFYLASALRNKPSIKKLIVVCIFSALLVVMLVAQRDLGGALIFFMTFMVVMYCATGSELLFFLGLFAASVGAFFAYRLFGHVQERVMVWQNPWSDIDKTGYQLTQALFAICTYGLFGIGLTRGYSAAIPVVERDFIFAAICEEFGSLFGLLLIGVFVMLFYRSIHIALRLKTPAYSLLAVGFTAILAVQTFVILGGDIKLIPMTGVTLPFISYGGSSAFICILMLGVLEWLYCRIPASNGGK